MDQSISIEQVDPRTTLWLRRLVLRPHQQVAELESGDAVPGLFAIGALVERSLACCALAMPEAFPDHPERPDAWRLRGMAAEERYRGSGLGTRVLARLVDEVRLRGGALLWCNARTPARRLYERAGFEVTGDEWTEPDIGPHLRMWREL